MTKNELVAFRSACSRQTGTGHLHRCIALANELMRRGLAVCLITDDNPLSRDIAAGFKGTMEYLPPQTLLPKRVGKPKAFIVDLPSFPNSLLDQPDVLFQLSSLNDAGVNIISLGHLGRNSQSFRAVIDLYPSQEVHAANYLEGPEFLILRPEFMEDFQDKRRESCAFVSMGGSDPQDLTKTALKHLAHLRFAGDIIVVLGAGYSADREKALKASLASSELAIDFCREVQDMRGLMRKATLGIVAFGTTAYELMSQRVPVLAYTHYVWQTPSAKLFEKLGCCLYMGCPETTGEIESLKHKITDCIQAPELMKKMADMGRSIVDGKGVKRVAGLIEKMVGVDGDDQKLDTLFVLAHPGDEMLGCGGTLINHIKKNERVGLVILGDGVSSRRKESDDVATTVAAKRELRAALQSVASELEIKTWYYFRFEDNRFDKHDLLDIIKVLESVFKRHKPHTVYTNHPGDLNVDHRRTYEAVATALRPEPGQCVSTLFSIEVPTSTDWGRFGHVFQPNWFVDITASLDHKLELLKIYSSEIREDPHPRSLNGIRDRAYQWGRYCGVKAAEAFVLQRHMESDIER